MHHNGRHREHRDRRCDPGYRRGAEHHRAARGQVGRAGPSERRDLRIFAESGSSPGVNQSNAEATKDGNTYKITGTAMGIDQADPLNPLYQRFEIDVTCP